MYRKWPTGFPAGHFADYAYMISELTVSMAWFRMLFILLTQAMKSATFNYSLMLSAFAICFSNRKNSSSA